MSEREDGVTGLGPLLVLASVGAGCFLAACFMLFFGSLPIASQDGADGWFVRIACIAALAFGLLAVPRIQERLERGKEKRAAIPSSVSRNLIVALASFVPLLMMNAVLASDAGAWRVAWYASWTLFGIFGAYFLSRWGSFYAKALEYFGRREVVGSICLSLITSALMAIIFLLVVGSNEPYGLRLSALAAALLMSQTAIYAYTNGRLEAVDVMGYEEYMDLWRGKLPLPMRFVRPFVVGWGLGVTSVLWIQFDGMQVVFAAFSAFLALNCVIYYCLGIVRREFPSIKTVDRLAVFTMAAGLLLVPFVEGLALSVMLGVAMMGCVAFFVQHWLVMIQGTTCYNSRPSHVFAHNAYSMLGILGGFSAIAVPIAMGASSLDGLCDVGSVSSVGLLILAYTLVTYENTVWDELFQYMNEIEEIPLNEEAEAASYEGQLQERLSELAAENGLTSRETEVFELLARGRNAAVIARELVISPYTSKTHIYHVYQKFGIKTRQELIDIVERTR